MAWANGTFVSEFATKTTLTTSALSADGNAPVTFTAVVTNQDGTNSPGVGQVDFFDGSTDLGSITLDGTGTAIFTTSFIVPDTHEITAVYAGYQTDGATYDQSTSTTLDETISPATQTITFVPIGGQTYGVDPFDLDPTASSLLPVGLTVLSGPATVDGDGLLTITGAGTVVVEASQAGDTDYDAATPVDQSFQVAPASLTITADDQTSAYGAAYPTLTASYNGFVDGDTPASLTTLPTLTTVAAASPVGSYAIDASGAVDSNYTITYATGTLTITPAVLERHCRRQDGRLRRRVPDPHRDDGRRRRRRSGHAAIRALPEHGAGRQQGRLLRDRGLGHHGSQLRRRLTHPGP